MNAKRKPGKTISKASKTSVRLATGVLGALFLVGAAQGAWLVYDKKVEKAVNDVKAEVKTLREEAKPQWNKGGNKGAYNPYSGRKNDYDLLDKVERTAAQGMVARCGKSDAFTGEQVWKLPDIPAGDMSGAQLSALRTEVCQRIVNAENLRFDQMLKAMSRIKARNEALKELAKNRASIDQPGQLDASTNNLEMFIADSQVEIQHMQATIAAYDSLIASLKQTQDIVANRALNGKEQGIEQGIRLATLTAAIAGAKLVF